MATSVRPQSTRSAFTAAFLSFLFPGLGQAYAGAYRRALLFAAPSLAAIVVALLVVLVKGLLWLGLWIAQPSVLGAFAFVNIALLAYRAFAALDAYRVAGDMPSLRQGPRMFGLRPGQLHPISALGLVVIMVVMASGHVFAGYWDAKLYNAEVKVADTSLDVSSPEPDDTDTPIPTVTFPPQMTFEPAPTIQPWTGKGRLNILLAGYDVGGRTDSLIVVSVDPVTKKVALFSILRDAVGVPIQPKSRLSQCVGPNFGQPITNLWNYAAKACGNLYKNGADAVKQALGYMFFGNQNAIQYYMAVGYAGFEKVVDTLGGVNINSTIPVGDNDFLYVHGSAHYRVYVPAGMRHMNGHDALVYARIGHHGRYGSSDWQRAIRQQQVVVALEQQADFDSISSHLNELIDELGSSVRTDILSQGPDVIQPLVDLARQIKVTDVKSYVWATSSPDYGEIRRVVKSVISSGGKAPDQLQSAIEEVAPIVVENGTGNSGQETTLTTQLQNLGLNAQASTAVPSQLGGKLRIQCLNGAETQYPATLSQLENIFGLPGPPSADPTAAIQIVNDPEQTAGFVIITGSDTPDISVTPAP